MFPEEAVGEYVHEKKYGESTEAITNYSFRLEPFLEFCRECGLTELSELNDRTVRFYKRERLQSETDIRTVGQQLRTFKDFLRFSDEDMIDAGVTPQGQGTLKHWE